MATNNLNSSKTEKEIPTNCNEDIEETSTRKSTKEIEQVKNKVIKETEKHRKIKEIPKMTTMKNEYCGSINNIINVLNEDMYMPINCKYYNESEFNSISHPNPKLTIFHMNVRSLNTNRLDLITYLENLNTKFHVITLSEIGKTSIRENASHFKHYKLYWHKSITKSGGTGIFIREDIQELNEREDLKMPSIHQQCDKYQVENVWIECKIPNINKPIIIGVIYRHPTGNIKMFNEEMEKVLQKINQEKKLCFLCGDFNIDIKRQEHLPSQNFINMMISENFIPHITCPTRISSETETIIDNIFVSQTVENMNERTTSGNLLTDISDHLPNFLIYGEQKKKKQYERPFVRIYSDKNIREFKKHIENEQNWIPFLNETDCNEAAKKYFDIVTQAHNSFFPLMQVSRKRYKDKKWITKGIRESCITKNKLYRRYLKNPTENNRNTWKIYRNKLKVICKEAECKYFRDIINDTGGSLKKMWDTFRPILNINKNNKNNDIAKILLNEKMVSQNNMIAEGINEYFCEIGEKLSKSIPCKNINYKEYMPKPTENTMYLTPVNEREVYNEISTLNVRKSIGHIDIPTKLLIACKCELSKYLTHLFNLSMNQGIFPSLLKTAQVIPIYKSNEKYLAQNYRPISILSVISKIFEKLIHKRMYKFLEKYHILYTRQFGFRCKRSTAHALIDVTERIKTAMDNNEAAVGIYLDLKKAFDTVNHDILLEKMFHYGFRGKIHEWFKSYLSNRKQFVKVNNTISEHRGINTGVPQGSVLGPLLFILYVNDIENCISEKCQIMLFADDTNVLLFGKDMIALKYQSEAVMTKLYKWLCSNKLTLNVTKTNFCIFDDRKSNAHCKFNQLTFGDACITRVETVKYLGMQINEKLSWNVHIENLLGKLVKTASTFKFLRNHVPNNCKKQLYYSYVYSKIVYGIEIYGITSKTQLNKLQVMQNRLLKILYKKDWLYGTNELHKELELLKIEDVSNLCVLKFIHKYRIGDVPEIFTGFLTERNTIHNYGTRYKNKYEIPKINKLSYGGKTLKYTGAKMYNKLPYDITMNCKISIKEFCNRIKKYFIKNYC